jgi:hypothetical protein
VNISSRNSDHSREGLRGLTASVGDDHLKLHQLLTAAQSTSFDKIAKARAEFVG